MDSKVLTFSGPFRAEDGSSVARKVTFQLGRKVTLLLGANTSLSSINSIRFSPSLDSIEITEDD
jgi:hypothetical protein